MMQQQESIQKAEKPQREFVAKGVFYPPEFA
jgi:hypothetical protein